MTEPDRPAGEHLAALQVRMDQLEAAVASMTGELSSVREQLTAMGWTRAAIPPAPPATIAPAASFASFAPPPSAPRAAPLPATSTRSQMLFGSPLASAREAAAKVRAQADSGLVGQQAASLESQLGSRVLSKIAVLLLLAGTAWFLKWAFDNRWVGPTGRVLIGLLVGAGVVVWSERFRRQGLAAFSYSLKAVGTGALYLSLWAGFQLYHLMPASIALLAMVAVAAANTVLAFTQESPLLAGYALLGAYLTPALLSTGGNHEVFLFSYLLAVALSVAVLVRLRPWHLLLCGALPATVAYYIAWYAGHYRADELTVTLLFTVLLWAVFAIVPTVAADPNSIIVAILTPLGAATFGALAVYSVLVDSGARVWEPWWSLLFAAAYLVLGRVRRGGVLAAIHLSLAIVFLTISIPLKATGRGITAGWLAEAVVLFWIANLPQADAQTRRVLRLLGGASLLLGVGGALLGPLLPFAGSGQPFLNRDFLTSLGALAALAAAAIISRRSTPIETDGHSGAVIATGAFVLGNLVLLVAMGREIHNLYLHTPAAAWTAASEHADFTFSGWLLVQGVANLAVGFLRRVALARWAGLLLLGVTLFKVFAYDMRSLGTGYHVLSYLGLGVVLMGVSFAYQKDWLNLREAVTGDLPANQEGQL